jgi:hypothetical protein
MHMEVDKKLFFQSGHNVTGEISSNAYILY